MSLTLVNTDLPLPAAYLFQREWNHYSRRGRMDDNSNPNFL
jgi:hypothetical protein